METDWGGNNCNPKVPDKPVNDASRTPNFPTHSSAKKLQLAASGLSTTKSSGTSYVQPFHEISNNCESRSRIDDLSVEQSLSHSIKTRGDNPARHASAEKQLKGALAKSSDAQQKPTLNQYLEKFKTFTFFFDILEENEKRRYRDLAFELGSKVAAFLAKGVTHLIICNRSIQGKEGHSQAFRDQQRKVASAQKLGIKIWDAERFQSLATKIATQVSRERHPRLYSLHEAITGQPPEIHLFAGKFLLVEDWRRKYKPVIVKEYGESSDKEHCPWPKLQFNNRNGRCAFAVHQSDNPDDVAAENDHKNVKHFRKRNTYADDRIIMPPPTIVKQVALSIASGIVSGSNALSLKRPTNEAVNTKIGRLEQRVTNMQHISGRGNNAGGKDKVSTKDCGSRKRARFDEKEAKPVGKAFYKRAGYCENCGVRYDEFIKHIKSKEHRDFANCGSHFADIDDFITLELGRPLAQHAKMDWDRQCDNLCSDDLDLDTRDVRKSPGSENDCREDHEASSECHDQANGKTSEVLDIVGDEAVDVSALSDDSVNSNGERSDNDSLLRGRKFGSETVVAPSKVMQDCHVQPHSDVVCEDVSRQYAPAVSFAPEVQALSANGVDISHIIASAHLSTTSLHQVILTPDREIEDETASIKFNNEQPILRSQNSGDAHFKQCCCILCAQTSDESELSDVFICSDA